jgi:AcrR family transcriptional regulator
MDIREVKTKRAIYNAFIELRSENPLEAIKIKDLAAKAEISKATFYLHYRDIYDLSEQLQKNLVHEIFSCISDPAVFFTSSKLSFYELERAFMDHLAEVRVLFSGSQELLLAALIEQEIKEAIYKIRPELKDDLRTNVRLSYRVFGAFCSYNENMKRFDSARVSEELVDLLDSYE